MIRLIRRLAVIALLGCVAPALAQDKPNILVIWGDDVGWSNVSAYNLGMMGYETPNIDRIASEGALFTHYYAQQSCTAGRSSFILGQHPFQEGQSLNAAGINYQSLKALQILQELNQKGVLSPPTN